TLLAQILLDKFTHFTAALTHEPHDHDIGRRAAGNHAEESRLSYARTCEEAHALTAAQGNEGINCPHPCRERIFDPLATERMRGHRRLRGIAVDGNKSQSVKRAPQGIEDTPEEFGARPRQRRTIACSHLASDVKARGFPKRHQKDAVLAKTDH